MSCIRCGKKKDTRLGVCFDCATKAERKAKMKKGTKGKGRLKKGFKYLKGGRIVKVKARRKGK